MIEEPRIWLYCDSCGEREEFEMTAVAGDAWDARNLQVASERAGWQWLGKDEHQCPDCVTCPDCGEIETICGCQTLCDGCCEPEVDCMCCGDCREYPCQCCSHCGDPIDDCECCEECGNDPCVCCEICGSDYCEGDCEDEDE